MDSLRFENFALISILIYMDSLIMGSGQLRLSLAKNIYHQSLNSPIISRKTQYGFNKLFRLNDGGILFKLDYFIIFIPQIFVYLYTFICGRNQPIIDLKFEICFYSCSGKTVQQAFFGDGLLTAYYYKTNILNLSIFQGVFLLTVTGSEETTIIVACFEDIEEKQVAVGCEFFVGYCQSIIQCHYTAPAFACSYSAKSLFSVGRDTLSFFASWLLLYFLCI